MLVSLKDDEKTLVKLQIAQLPCADLAGPLSTVYHSSFNSDEAVAWHRVISALSSAIQDDAVHSVPFDAGTSTRLLRDGLVGNSRVTLLHTLQQFDSANSAALRGAVSVLSTARALAALESYPLKCTSFQLGLSRQERLLACHWRSSLRTELAAMRRQAANATQHESTRLVSVQQQLLSAQEDSRQLLQQKQRLSEAFAAFRTRFDSVTEEKARLAKHLVKCEREKLQLSRTAIETRLQHNKEAEEATAARFELEAKLLAEQESANDKRKECAELNAKIVDLEATLKSETGKLQDQATKLHTAVADRESLRRECVDLRARNERLGMEVLKKVALEKELAKQAKEIDANAQKQRAIEERRLNMQDGNDALRAAKEEAEKNVAQMRAELSEKVAQTERLEALLARFY
ncbi:MAG: hypothetical protein MHM6MM_000519 [Cercozoa sp. M6MM]